MIICWQEAVMNRATGTFEVKLNPQQLADKTADATLGRLSIDKQFQGDLELSVRERCWVRERVLGLSRIRRDWTVSERCRVAAALRAAAHWYDDARYCATECHCCAWFRHRSAGWACRDNDNQYRWRETFLRLRVHNCRNPLKDADCDGRYWRTIHRIAVSFKKGREIWNWTADESIVVRLLQRHIISQTSRRNNIMAKKPLLLRKTVSIKAPALKSGKHWRPGMDQTVLFGTNVISTGKLEAQFVLSGRGGKEYEDKGTILNSRRENLSIQLLEFLFIAADVPENYAVLTFELSSHGDRTELLLTQDNIANETRWNIPARIGRGYNGTMKACWKIELQYISHEEQVYEKL